MSGPPLESRFEQAVALLEEALESVEDRCGGQYVIKGTRFTLAQVFAELADQDISVVGLADDFDLDPTALKKLFEGLSILASLS